MQRKFITRPRTLLVIAIVLAAAGIGLIAEWNHHFRNLHTVEPRVLYRSGQLSRTGFGLTLRAHRIKTVVTLRTVRDPAKPYLDEWEADVCRERGIRHIRILPRSWIPDASGRSPGEESVHQFLNVIENPDNHPVLVHCFAGVHRTGTMCAAFRIRQQGWPAERAIEEMEEHGFEPGDDRAAIETFLRELGAKIRPSLSSDHSPLMSRR
jgi:tyrosine-protein phosphatase SIW14